jgi:hypothetical protein
MGHTKTNKVKQPGLVTTQKELLALFLRWQERELIQEPGEN